MMVHCVAKPDGGQKVERTTIHVRKRSDYNRMEGVSGGEGGIRTHGTRKGTTVFETVPIDHSGTSPRGNRACQMAGPVDRGRASNVVVVAAQAAACAARKSN